MMAIIKTFGEYKTKLLDRDMSHNFQGKNDAQKINVQ